MLAWADYSPETWTRTHPHTHTHTQHRNRATGSDNDDDFYWQEAHAACMPIAVCRCRLLQADCILSTCLLLRGDGGQVREGAKSLAIIVIIDAVKYVCSHYLGTVCPRDAIVQMEL